MIIIISLMVVGILFTPLFLMGVGAGKAKQDEMKANKYFADKYDEDNK